MLQKTLVESFFWIPIKMYLVKAPLGKTFWLKALLQEATPNWPKIVSWKNNFNFKNRVIKKLFLLVVKNCISVVVIF